MARDTAAQARSAINRMESLFGRDPDKFTRLFNKEWSRKERADTSELTDARKTFSDCVKYVESLETGDSGRRILSPKGKLPVGFDKMMFMIEKAEQRTPENWVEPPTIMDQKKDDGGDCVQQQGPEEEEEEEEDYAPPLMNTTTTTTTQRKRKNRRRRRSSSHKNWK